MKSVCKELHHLYGPEIALSPEALYNMVHKVRNPYIANGSDDQMQALQPTWSLAALIAHTLLYEHHSA